VNGSSRSNNIVHDSDQVVSRGLVGQEVEVSSVSKVEVVASKGDVRISEDVEDELSLDVAVFNVVEVDHGVEVSGLNVGNNFEVSSAVASEFSSNTVFEREDSIGSSGSPGSTESSVESSGIGKV